MAGGRGCLPGTDSSCVLDKHRLRALASRQFGVVARRQLLHLGIPRTTVDHWAVSGLLAPLHRGVYAVGHTALSTEARLTAAVLYAGPGAMLSHATAAWWLDLTSRRPEAIELSTPRHLQSIPGLAVHGRRAWARREHRGVPVAPIAEVLLDYAAAHALDDVRYVLAQAEYRQLLDLRALETLPRRAGSARLRAALRRHQPQLARTRSALERMLWRLCERHGLPVPEVNQRVEGHLVDAVWRAQRVIVEVDGRDGHAGWARMRADHARDLALRAAGWVVLRYTWEQVECEGAAVAADIERALGAACGSIRGAV